MKTKLNKKEKVNIIKTLYPSVKFLLEEFNAIFHEIDEEGRIVVQLNMNENEFLAHIDSDIISFTDVLVNYDRGQGSLKGIKKEDWMKRQKSFSDNLAELGFQLEHSGIGGFDDYEFYDIVSYTNDFRVSKLERASELWSEYNKASREILKS